MAHEGPFLGACVRANASIVVSTDTGSSKTSAPGCLFLPHRPSSSSATHGREMSFVRAIEEIGRVPWSAQRRTSAFLIAACSRGNMFLSRVSFDSSRGHCLLPNLPASCMVAAHVTCPIATRSDPSELAIRQPARLRGRRPKGSARHRNYALLAPRRRNGVWLSNRSFSANQVGGHAARRRSARTNGIVSR